MKPFICKADVVCRAGARYRQKTSKQSLSGIEDRRLGSPHPFPFVLLAGEDPRTTLYKVTT